MRVRVVWVCLLPLSLSLWDICKYLILDFLRSAGTLKAAPETTIIIILIIAVIRQTTLTEAGFPNGFHHLQLPNALWQLC